MTTSCACPRIRHSVQPGRHTRQPRAARLCFGANPRRAEGRRALRHRMPGNTAASAGASHSANALLVRLPLRVSAGLLKSCSVTGDTARVRRSGRQFVCSGRNSTIPCRGRPEADHETRPHPTGAETTSDIVQSLSPCRDIASSSSRSMYVDGSLVPRGQMQRGRERLDLSYTRMFWMSVLSRPTGAPQAIMPATPRAARESARVCAIIVLGDASRRHVNDRPWRLVPIRHRHTSLRARRALGAPLIRSRDDPVKDRIPKSGSFLTNHHSEPTNRRPCDRNVPCMTLVETAHAVSHSR